MADPLAGNLEEGCRKVGETRGPGPSCGGQGSGSLEGQFILGDWGNNLALCPSLEGQQLGEGDGVLHLRRHASTCRCSFHAG